MGRAKHCSVEERFVIKRLKNEGQSQRMIAKTLRRSQTFVCHALAPQKKYEIRGRPRKTTEKIDNNIKLTSSRDPFKSAEAIKVELGLEISARTVRRRLVEKNLFGRKARKVPVLTKRHRQNRIASAIKHCSWDGPIYRKKWRNILWSDESNINLIGNDGKTWVRRPKGAEYNPRFTTKTFKHGGGSIMVWGCFSWYGVGPLYWIKETMDKNLYVHILDKVMLPYAEWEMPLKRHFQQDNDPKHTSGLAKKWFSDNKVNVIAWPSQSPDINPIENLWKIVKEKVGPIKAKNKEELWKQIQ